MASGSEPEGLSFSVESFGSMLSNLAYERYELIDEDRGDAESTDRVHNIFSEQGITFEDAIARCGENDINVMVDETDSIQVEGSDETQSGYHIEIMDASRDEVGLRTLVSADIPAGEGGEVNLVDLIKDYLEPDPELSEAYADRVEFEDRFFSIVEDWGQDNGLTFDKLDVYLEANPDAGFSIRADDLYDEYGAYEGTKYELLDQDGNVLCSAIDDLSNSFEVFCEVVEEMDGSEKYPDLKECFNAFAESAESIYGLSVDEDDEEKLPDFENTMMEAVEAGIEDEVASSASQNDSINSIDTDSADKIDTNPIDNNNDNVDWDDDDWDDWYNEEYNDDWDTNYPD